MSHYASSYEADREHDRQVRIKQLEAVLSATLAARREFSPYKDQFDEQRANQSLLDAEVFLRHRIVNLKGQA
jgi:hypothetical protein